jgi:hypothetical protein
MSDDDEDRAADSSAAPEDVEPSNVHRLLRRANHPGHSLGILDIDPKGLKTPPAFTEPETIDAMRRLGYVPEDLIVVNRLGIDFDNISIRDKVLAELDRRRMQLVDKLIAERNRIVHGQPTPRANKIIRFRTRRRRRKKKAGKARRFRKVLTEYPPIRRGAPRRPPAPPAPPGQRQGDTSARRKMAEILRQRHEKAERRLRAQAEERRRRLKEQKEDADLRQERASMLRLDIERERIKRAQQRLRDVDVRYQKIMEERRRKREMRAKGTMGGQIPAPRNPT